MTDYTNVIHNLRLEQYSIVYAAWLENVFTARWWLLVGLVITMYTLWWILVDKARLKTLLLYGSLVAVSRVILDVVVAINLGRWVYAVSLFPMAPDIFVHDLTVTPLTYMMVYQYSNSWKQFWIANLIGSSLIFYGILPLFEYLGIFKGFPGWTLTSSFLVIFIAAGVMRAIMILIKNVEDKAKAKVKQASEQTSFIAKPAMKPDDNKE